MSFYWSLAWHACEYAGLVKSIIQYPSHSLFSFWLILMIIQFLPQYLIKCDLQEKVSATTAREEDRRRVWTLLGLVRTALLHLMALSRVSQTHHFLLATPSPTTWGSDLDLMESLSRDPGGECLHWDTNSFKREAGLLVLTLSIMDRWWHILPMASDLSSVVLMECLTLPWWRELAWTQGCLLTQACPHTWDHPMDSTPDLPSLTMLLIPTLLVWCLVTLNTILELLHLARCLLLLATLVLTSVPPLSQLMRVSCPLTMFRLSTTDNSSLAPLVQVEQPQVSRDHVHCHHHQEQLLILRHLDHLHHRDQCWRELSLLSRSQERREENILIMLVILLLVILIILILTETGHRYLLTLVMSMCRSSSSMTMEWRTWSSLVTLATLIMDLLVKLRLTMASILLTLLPRSRLLLHGSDNIRYVNNKICISQPLLSTC